MQNTFGLREPIVMANSGTAFSLIESRIEALKALATLLLNEVESLKTMPAIESKINAEDPIDLSKELEQLEVELIRNALIRSKGHQSNAARLLGVKKTTLNAKIRRYEIDTYIPLARI